jgi:3D (Asp-Asp-Asp) domain-containing protein
MKEMWKIIVHSSLFLFIVISIGLAFDEIEIMQHDIENINARLNTRETISVQCESDEEITIEETTTDYLGEFKITAYCHCEECCGKSDGLTFTGSIATPNRTIAVDPNIIPLGSEVMIDGQIYIAEDVGGSIKGNRIDIYMTDHQQALNYGVQYKNVSILEEV